MKRPVEHTRSRKTILLIYFCRLAFLVLAAVGLHHTAKYILTSPEGARWFQPRQIVFTGLNHLDRSTVEALVRRDLPRNLLLVDPTHVREVMEAEPWVKSAKVRRMLPDRLDIYVTEREYAAPARIDDELYVVDSEGIILERYGPQSPVVDRPIVKGLKNLALENARQENIVRMRAYLQVVEALRTSKKDYSDGISEIDVENPRRIGVIPTDDPTPIYLGNDRFVHRYETFLASKGVYEQLKIQYGRIEYVDVSYDNKIIFHRSEAAEAKPKPGDRTS